MPTTEQSLWRALAQVISGNESNLGDFDDEQIMAQANLHGVSLLLNAQLRAGTVSGISETVTERLNSDSHQNAAYDLILNEATQIILDLLAEHEISALLLKGTPVAHLYYPNTYLRQRCDTDLYICENDVEKTATLLAANKYQLSGLEKRKISSKQFMAAAPSVQKNFLHFDMHWKLSNRVLFKDTIPFEECLKTSQPVAELGPNAHTLSITDLLIHACVHRIAHGRNTQSNRLIWLYDIHLLVNAMSADDQKQFPMVAIQKAIGYLCADALETCQTIFNTTLPEEFLSLLRTNYKHEPSAKLLKSSKLGWAWADMQSLQGVRQKVAFAKELLFD